MKILLDINSCTGCTACQFSCPTDAVIMKSDNKGFLYPFVCQDKCIGCGKCQKVCPVNNAPVLNKEPECYAAINMEENIRVNSSSGGVFYLVAEFIVNCGGTVYGAAYDDDQRVVHARVSSIKDIKELQGAKYSQSYLGDIYTLVKEDLDNRKQVLFSGTPCQVAGLKAFLGKEYDNLLLVDMVCHGVPSPKAWKHYLEYRKELDGQIDLPSNINLRSKETGWSRYHYSVQFIYPSGYQYHRINGDDPYMKSFVSDMTLRPSCNECHFKGTRRCSDITLGDFWGIWDINPGMDDDKGTSLVMVHSEAGRKIWNQVKSDCMLATVETKDTYAQNPSIIRSSETNPLRDKILEQLDQESFEIIEKELEKIRKTNSKRPSLLRRVFNRLK